MRNLLLSTLLLLACACATAGSDTQGTRRQRDLLTREDIRKVEHLDLFDVVSVLRPNWLRTRGQISIGDPEAGKVVVYMDGIRAGGAEYLRQIRARDVASVRYLDETEANARFGIKQGGGAAILVTIDTSGRG